MQVLLWTSKSVRRLAVELRERGFDVHFTTVAHVLRSLGYSLQSNRKSLEGSQHPDRDTQFRLINERVCAAIAAGEPAISIDTKKKELVGEFANKGREWRAKGDPIKVSTHDFPSQAEGKAIPYGVYTIPEISVVGKTEEELTAAKINYEIGISRFEELAKGQMLGTEVGMLKILFDPKSLKLLGVHVIGESATEIVHIGQAVLALGGTIEYFRDTVFNYPTFAEAYKVAGLDGLNRL